jgi:hypothetical protein
MRTILTAIVFFISASSFSQNLNELGLDNKPTLTETESTFLTD